LCLEEYINCSFHNIPLKSAFEKRGGTEMSELTQQIISFKVNGDDFTSAEGMTLMQLIQEMKLEQKRIAVELNEEIVPRSRHNEVILKAGDSVEVVTAIGGG